MKQRFTKLLMGAAFVAGGVSSAYADDYVPTIYAGSTEDITAAGKTVGLVKFQPNADNSAITPEVIKEPVPASGDTHTTPSLFGSMDTFNSNTYNNWQPWCLMSGVLKDGKWIGYYGVYTGSNLSIAQYNSYYKEYDVSDDEPKNWKAVTDNNAKKDAVYLSHQYAYMNNGWVARDATYDPVTKKIYATYQMTTSGTHATFFGTNSGKTVIAEIDYNGFTNPQTRTNKTRIKIGSEYLVGLAANSKGHFYGFGDEGSMVRILNFDDNDAVENENYVYITLPDGIKAKLNGTEAWGSATFDPNTGKLYYVVRHGGGARSNSGVQALLFEFDIDEDNNKATVKEVGTFPAGYIYTSLFIKELPKAAGTPAAATGLSVNDEGTQVSFTLPNEDTNGNSLTGTVSYSIVVNEGTPITGSAAAGSAVNQAVTLEDGPATIQVTVTANGEESAPTGITTYVGLGDTPQAVTDLTFTEGTPGHFTLNWTAPTEGTNGGKLKAENLTYVVTRLASNGASGATSSLYKEDKVFEATVGTTFTDEVSPAAITHYKYQVAAVNNSKQGSATTTSNYFTVSPSYNIPFEDTFPDRTTFEGTYVVGTSSNGNWAYDPDTKKVRFEGDATASTAASVFLISPALPMEADTKYTVKLDITSRDSWESVKSNLQYDDLTEEQFLATLKYNIYVTQAEAGSSVNKSTELIKTISGKTVYDGGVIKASFTAPGAGNYRIAIEAANSVYKYKADEVDDEGNETGKTTTETGASNGITLNSLAVTDYEPFVDLAATDIVSESGDVIDVWDEEADGYFKIKVTVANNGDEDASDFTITLKDQNDDTFSQVRKITGTTIAAGESKQVDVWLNKYSAGNLDLYASVSIEGDANDSNNDTKAISLKFYESAIEVEIPEEGWLSFYNADFNVKPQGGAKAYIVTSFAAAGATLEEVEVIPAGTPVLVNGDAGYYEEDDAFTVEKTVDAAVTSLVEGNLLNVSDGTTAVSNGKDYFCLAKLDGGVGFGVLANGLTVPEGKVYVYQRDVFASAADAARQFVPLLIDETTAVKAVGGSTQNVPQVFFSLSGQRVSKPSKGLYIVDGKKVVIK